MHAHSVGFNILPFTSGISIRVHLHSPYHCMKTPAFNSHFISHGQRDLPGNSGLSDKSWTAGRARTTVLCSNATPDRSVQPLRPFRPKTFNSDSIATASTTFVTERYITITAAAIANRDAQNPASTHNFSNPPIHICLQPRDLDSSLLELGWLVSRRLFLAEAERLFNSS